MIKKSIAVLAFLLSLSCLANQGVNTNPNFNQMQDNEPPQSQNQPMGNNFAPPGDEASNISHFAGETQGTNTEQSKTVQQSDTVFDIKTTHGSVMIKKLPPKPQVNTVKTTADTQETTDSKPYQNQSTPKPQT